MCNRSPGRVRLRVRIDEARRESISVLTGAEQAAECGQKERAFERSALLPQTPSDVSRLKTDINRLD